MSEDKPDREIDCIGLYCPEPVFRTRQELDEMKPGETLSVEADDPAAEEDIKRLTKNLGHELINFRKEGDRLYFIIKKTK